MVLMTIDHTQEYQAGPGRGLVTDPMNLAVTPGPVYFFRILSHFCAPVFALLMGVSAFLSAQRRAPAEASRHLLYRGLLLLALEATVINWCWTFNPFWPRYFFQIIGALGVAMVVLAAAVRLPRAAVAALGVALVALHNLFDGVSFAPATVAHYVWSLLHQKNVLPLFGGFEVRTTYPVVPVVGLALCGYALGAWSVLGERKWLLRAGVTLVGLFLLLRLTGLYGDPHPWVPQPDPVRSFFNVTKYPLLFQFVLMTIGPALVALALLRGRRQAWLEQLGRTAMFYYVAHLVALHAVMLLCATLLGYPYDVRNFGGVGTGFGFPVWATAPIALLVAAGLRALCRWYEPRRLPFL